ncbi:MAG: methionine--tRNA ligase subunit beta [Patescibacteria group bacterium]|nr:MAG: methionine--tRNA ligase subunit beta [Patescibacteria group bacterium]
MKTVSFEEFSKVDIRIGTVVRAEVPKWSHWVMKLIVDFGPEIGERTIFAGIMHFFKAEDLIGKQFPFVVNLEPKKIGPEGDFSQGMLLAASPVLNKPVVINDEEITEEPVLFTLSKKVPNGTKVR